MDDIKFAIERLADDLGVDRKRSIGEVAEELKVATHVIRFWEEHFPQIKPQIGLGKRRYYYNEQIKILKRIKKFLYEEGYTVAGLQKLLKKRKHDDHKEEDLDIILSMKNSDQDDQLFDFENTEENSNLDQTEGLEKAARKLGLDDFIINPVTKTKAVDETKIIPIEDEVKINPKAKLLNFSSIQVSAIDPRIRSEVENLLKNFRGNLQQLKSLNNRS